MIPAMSEEVKDSLIKNIRRRMTPQPLKIRADIEMKCFQFDGVLHIKVLIVLPVPLFLYLCKFCGRWGTTMLCLHETVSMVTGQKWWCGLVSQWERLVLLISFYLILLLKLVQY